MIKQFFACLLAALSLCSCGGKRSAGDSPLGDYQQHYFFYLSADSLSPVQCVAEFRKEREDGQRTLLPQGYSVWLDGKALPADTAVYPVYSEERSRETAEGAHLWRLKQGDRSLLEIPFRFRKFGLADPIDSLTCRDADLPFRVTGLSEGDSVECWFDNSDMNNASDRFVYRVRNGVFTLLKSDFQHLKQGRYQLRISSNQGAPVQMAGKTCGKWEASFILNPIPARIR